MRLVAVGVAAAISLGAQSQRWTPACAPVGRTQSLPGVPEASGVARAGGALWTHNDSGVPVLFRVDPDGQLSSVAVSGATSVDWEDIAAGRCGDAECLYIADIGDNARCDSGLRSTRLTSPRVAAARLRPPERSTPATRILHTMPKPYS